MYQIFGGNEVQWTYQGLLDLPSPLDNEKIQYLSDDNIYDELDRIEPELIETLSYRPKRALFHYPLGVALLLMMLGSFGLLLTRGRAVAHG